jgi:hypothetical protein
VDIRMIPAFNDDGYLPPGVHQATMEEIAARFGQESEVRRVQMQSLGWLVDLARRAGALRLIVNGSFVTDWPEPNDVDCVLLIGPGFPRDAAAEKELVDGLPFVELKIVGAEDFALFVQRVFASDRQAVPKGMIEVVL